MQKGSVVHGLTLFNGQSNKPKMEESSRLLAGAERFCVQFVDLAELRSSIKKHQLKQLPRDISGYTKLSNANLTFHGESGVHQTMGPLSTLRS